MNFAALYRKIQEGRNPSSITFGKKTPDVGGRWVKRGVLPQTVADAATRPADRNDFELREITVIPHVRSLT
jgi:hypothetical protein